MPKRILVTGANGQVGSELQSLAAQSQDHFMFVNRTTLDLSAADAITAYFEENSFDAVINCAAYTAVDKAESDESMAYAVNHKAVEMLADIAKAKEMQLIHISTDYVFDGTAHSPYVERDTANPQSVYGASKLAGEEAILKIKPKNAIIIRTSWLYSSFGSNFVKTMLRLGKEREELGVVSDQIGTPTYARDLAKSILELIPKIKNEKVEIYHYANEGVCSWYDFAKEIMSLAKIECQINPIETIAYPTPAKRPHCSLLNKAKIKKTFDLAIPYWKDSLDECLETLGEGK